MGSNPARGATPYPAPCGLCGGSDRETHYVAYMLALGEEPNYAEVLATARAALE